MLIPGSGSDFAPFVDQHGVICFDLSYTYDKSLGLSSYPLYHSVYETFHLANDIVDPTFEVSYLHVFYQRNEFPDHINKGELSMVCGVS